MDIAPRSRIISVRLTADEYISFRDLCYAQGIPTLSELARKAMQIMVQQSPSQSCQDSVETRLSQLEGRLKLLTLEVNRLDKQKCLT
jgi:hypothetical protein